MWEVFDIIFEYARKTTRLTGIIINELRNLVCASDIAKKTTVSPSFISKILPYLAVTNSKLSRVLCIDEFKGNSGNNKYQVALINGETHEVFDIIECRYKHVRKLLLTRRKNIKTEEQIDELNNMLNNYSENLSIAS